MRLSFFNSLDLICSRLEALHIGDLLVCLEQNRPSPVSLAADTGRCDSLVLLSGTGPGKVVGLSMVTSSGLLMGRIALSSVGV